MQKHKKYDKTMQRDIPKGQQPTVTDAKDSEEKESPKNKKT
jgi:hypothetical protein